MCAAVGATKRAWRPVGQMLLWQVQGSTHGHGHAPATVIRSLSILSHSGSSSGKSSSSSNTTTWLYQTVAKDAFLPARSFGAERSWSPCLSPSASQVRLASGGSALRREEEPEEQPQQHKAENGSEMVNSNYWGVTTKTFNREDGTTWPWNCFKPTDTYAPDVNVDIKKHREPTSYNEWLAMWVIRMIKIPVNLFYSTRYGCRAMMLETVAAVPGMVGGMLLHLRSLRRFEHSGGWIKALLDEAENERMHLMTLMELVQPAWYERALVVAVQGVFFNVYFVLYLLSPRLAHRVTGYLEEEAVISYTTFLEGIDKGVVENVPAPAIAIDYWRLPPDATLRDMVIALRADEAHHRDVNHYAADIRQEGKQLNESPAPVDYH